MLDCFFVTAYFGQCKNTVVVLQIKVNTTLVRIVNPSFRKTIMTDPFTSDPERPLLKVLIMTSVVNMPVILQRRSLSTVSMEVLK